MGRSAVATLRRHAAGTLVPGEDFVAGVQLQRAGYSNSTGAAVLGGMLGAAIHSATQRNRLADRAVTLKSAGYFAVTNERVLIFKTGATFRPTQVLSEISRSDAVLDIEPFRTLGLPRARLRLRDGSRTIVEAESAGHGRVADELVDVRAAVPRGTDQIKRR